MTLTVHPELIQGSEEWLTARRGIITASTVGQLIATGKLGAIDFPCTACGSDAFDPCCSKVNGKPIKTLHPERVEYARQNAVTIIEPAVNDTSRGLTMLLASERITGWTEPTYVSDDMIRGMAGEPMTGRTSRS